MNKLIATAAVTLVLTACSSTDNTNMPTSDTTASNSSATQAAKVPLPTEVDNKFTQIMDDYQLRIQTKFFSASTSTTRRGGEGTTENTFDATAFDKFMKKKGFSKLSTGQMDYQGKLDNIEITISEKTTSGDRGGWIHNWTIYLESVTADGAFKGRREFSVDPGGSQKADN